jgi:hypothetical protein
MATSSTFVVNGVSVTRIDSHDQLPLAANTTATRKSNAPGCGSPIACDYPPLSASVDTIAPTNRFPTGTLTAGVYKS